MVEKTLVQLVRAARSALGVHTDTDFAKFLGVSRRTVQRHHYNFGVPSQQGADKLVRAFFAADPDTARALAGALRVDIQDLESTSTASAAARVPTIGPGHVAMLVMGVAEALEKPVRETRALLSTVFEGALALGVDLNELAPLLVVKKEPEKKALAQP